MQTPADGVTQCFCSCNRVLTVKCGDSEFQPTDLSYLVNSFDVKFLKLYDVV